METVEAGGLHPMVVGVPAAGGMEGAEGIDEVGLGGEIIKGGCCDALCAAPLVVWSCNGLRGVVCWCGCPAVYAAIKREVKIPP